MRISKIIIKFSVIIIVIICFVLLFIHKGINPFGKPLNGKNIFPNSYWENINSITFCDFDENRYEIKSTQHIKEIQNILQTLTYREIINPEIEGCYSFEIYTSDKYIDFWISRDILGINGKTYQISDNSMDLRLSDYIKSNSDSF